MVKSVIVTKHAITRYRERVESCSKANAIDRITHAAQISRQLTTRQLEWLRRNRYGAYGGVYLYCEPESLVLICSRNNDKLIIVTIAHIPTNDELRIIEKRRQKSARRLMIEYG